MRHVCRLVVIFLANIFPKLGIVNKKKSTEIDAENFFCEQFQGKTNEFLSLRGGKAWWAG